MQLNHVPVEVAIRRMKIYGNASVAECKDRAKALLSGETVTYTAYDVFDRPIGQTTLTPEDSPVTLVTETNT